MKIAFVITSMTKGGAERVVSNLANYFANNNDEVTIITLINTDIEYEINEDVQIVSVDEEYTDRNIIENNYSIIKKCLKHLKNINKERMLDTRLKNVIKNIDADVYVAFLPKACFEILKYRKLINKPIIISVRNDPKIEYRRFDNRIKMLYYYRKANGFVFQTEEARKYFNTKIQNKSTIIPNPINVNFLNSDVMVEKEKKIVSVGRLVEQKNHKLLIDAFNVIQKKYPDYKLYLYGEGYLRQDIERQIEKLQLKKKVILFGNANDIKKEIINATLFIMSSNYEGMPNALMEAMCLGLPVISTDCPCRRS